jgi:RNA polymerase sigma factor (sigma-70 family)
MSGEPRDGAGMAPDPEERALLRRLQDGGQEGLAGLIDRYGEALMRYLHSMLRDRDGAEDAFQEAWVHVARKIRRFDSRRPFGPWLFRVARNLAYDELRRRKRRSFFGLREPPLEPGPYPGWGGSAAAERLAAEELAGKLLARLEPGHREIIWLRFYRECSYEEIAGICGIPVGTVKSRLRRALDRLGTINEEMESVER